MFFKGLKQSLNSLAVIITFLTMIFLLCFGCSNDHNFENEPLVASLDFDTDCLSLVKGDFQLYFDGLLPETRLRANFNCLNDGIDYFQEKVKQEKPGFYTLREITNLFNRFLSDSDFSDAFYQNFFVLKSEIFGGEDKLLSQSELLIIKTFLTDLEVLMVEILPYAEVVFFGEGLISEEALKFSLKRIEAFLKKWLNFKDVNISEKNFINILKEMSTNSESAINVAGDSWYRVFDLLRNASEKTVLLNKEKNEAVDKIIEIMNLAVNLNLVLDSDWLGKREKYLDFEREISKILDFFKLSLGNAKWDSEDLLDFFRVFDGLNLLHENFNLKVQEEFVRLLFDKYFPDNSEDGKGSLSKENFDLILDEWNFFTDFVDKTEPLEGFIGSKYPLVLSGQEPFQRLTRSAWPVLVEGDGDTLFTTDKVEDVEFRFRSLFHVSWQVLAAKLLIKTYALDENRAENLLGLELLEVRDAYLDLFEILLQTDILDEGSRGSWFRIFNEINLFIPSANPDNYSGLIEATEYLAYLFSGINAGDEIAEKVNVFCPSYDKACVEETFQKSSELLFTTMPTLSNYFTLLPSEESLTEWFDSFEYIAKLDNNDEPYGSSLIFRGTIANQYVETIFRKFDLLGDDLIDFKDSELAYGTFKEALNLLPQVQGTIAENDDEFLFGFFSFFIKEGRLPKFRGSVPAREFTVWKRDAEKCQKDWEKYGEEKCGYKVDRSRILALLAFLTSIEFTE